MRSYLRRKLAEIRGCTSGNATLIVALGMPMLVGGAGLGVDLAQWYMWKRELQFAVDQAAIAGAWARSETATQATYQTRATQEYNANLAAVEDFATAPTVSLADYNGGTQNSVVVEASASQVLPFSNLLTGSAATISASAQAVVEGGQIFTTCMLAVDPDDPSSFIVAGSADGSASCGFGALSDSATAMVKNGQSDIQAGYLVSGGGIDRGLAANGTLYANTDGLQDPYEDLDPPDSPISRTYFCPPVIADTVTTTADVTVQTKYEYSYVMGKQFKKADPYNYSGAKSTTTTSEFFPSKTIANDMQEGTYTDDPVYVETVVATDTPSKGNSVWEVRKSTVTNTVANRVQTIVAGSDGIARPQPGTYSSISIACETRFAPGVYVINDTLDFGQNMKVIGTDVMFVLKAADKIHINSKSDINLSGITATTLLDYGVPSDEAEKLAGMLIFDPESDDQMKVNGNATLKLEGVIYMPGRQVVWNGNSSASGKCMMLAAGKITLSGNNNLTNFCVPAGMTGMKIGGAEKSVKLVA